MVLSKTSDVQPPWGRDVIGKLPLGLSFILSETRQFLFRMSAKHFTSIALTQYSVN